MSEKQFSEMHKVLSRIRIDISETNKILETLQKQQINGTHETIRAINNLLTAQQETHLASAIANLASKKDQLLNEEEVVSLEQDEFSRKLDDTSDNYKKLQDELDDDLNNRIKRIGEHIFKIVEDEGEQQIETVQEEKNKAFENIRGTIKEIYETKISEFMNVFKKLTDNIMSFINIRKDSVDHVKTFLVNKKVSRPLKIYIPFWIIQMENLKTKNNIVKVFGPGEFSQNGYSASQEYEGIRNILESSLNKIGLTYVKSEKICATLKTGIEQMHEKNMVSDEIMNSIMRATNIIDIGEIKVGG